MEYTSTEKLIADNVAVALEQLDDAWQAMRQLGWHKTTDRDTRLIYLGVNAALNSQDKTHAAAKAVLDAPLCPQINRLAEWTGHTQDETENQPKDPKA